MGEPAYETGAFVRNRLPDLPNRSGSGRFLSRRIRLIADQLGLDAERVRLWSLAQAILSAWWYVEDGGEYSEEQIALAEALDGFSFSN